MYNSINEAKEELQRLCSEYINILEKLKREEIITKDTFETCSLNKFLFLEE